ncbi:MAG: LPS export ABC transporter ATP-binding protein [Elusimicrobiales bacterium]|nr:LPS export ABC transporter ATP-binding protein [Elusimicrobiales bacterium]
MELRAQGIEKNYKDRKVVKGIDIRVSSGEICGLLGPNGAGKTTTFHMLVGFIRPDGGKIFIDDADISALPMYERARRGIGYLAQEPTIFRGLTVEENLLAVLERILKSRKEQEVKVKSLLEEFGLWALRKQKAWTLSGGEKRRLEVARAMINEPKIMLLDEPFVGIDPITVSDLKRIIFQLRDKGLGVLITDHNVRETLDLVQRAYLICDGQILIEGPRETLLNDPAARRYYLGEDFKM